MIDSLDWLNSIELDDWLVFACLQAREDFMAMLVTSDELKVTHPFRRAKELYESDARWKVGGRVVGAQRAGQRGCAAATRHAGALR